MFIYVYWAGASKSNLKSPGTAVQTLPFRWECLFFLEALFQYPLCVHTHPLCLEVGLLGVYFWPFTSSQQEITDTAPFSILVALPLICQEAQSRLPGLLPRLPFSRSVDLEEGRCSWIPKINVSRDSLSLEYKESCLGDNPEVACQSKNSLRHCAGISVGGVALRTGSVTRLYLLASSHHVHLVVCTVGSQCSSI